MSYSATKPIIETHRSSIFADVDYDVDPGFRGSRDEPSRQPIAIIEDIRLYRVSSVYRRDVTGNLKLTEVREDITEPTPRWIMDLIEEDTDWLLEIAMEDAA